MKEKIKEYKRKLLKNIQAKLRRFLNTEYRTPQEIQKDTMDFYVSELEKSFPLRFKDNYSTMSQYIGDINYLKSKDGNTYYKNHKTGDWIDSISGDVVTEQQLKEIVENK